jgi:GAF domain-containing protein
MAAGQPDQILTIVLGGTLRIPPDSDSILVVPLQVERGAPVIGFLKALNRFGGPSRAGRQGIFSQRDESNLRDLAYITAAAILRQEASRSTLKFMSSIPSIALLRDEESAAKALEGLVQSAMNSDDVYAFILNGERDFVCHNPTKHNETLSPSMKLPYKTYPLSIAAEQECVHIADLKMVSERILARNPFQTDALMRSACAMAVCGIRNSDRALFGVILIVNARERSFSDADMALFGEICSLTGSVLASSVTFQRSKVISSEMHTASRELLDIANQREVEALFLHVATRLSEYMNCSRAVLYLVDNMKNVLWTVLESGTVITTELKENVTLEEGSIRTGFANIAASQLGYVNIKDFAHGHRAYNDLLDSADIAHVEKVNRLQPGRINTDSSILLSHTVLSSQAEKLDADEATESVAALAIRAKSSSKVIAVIQVMNKWKKGGQGKLRLNRGGFDENDLSKLQLLSEAISAALQTCGVLSRRWQSEIELRILFEYAAKGQSVCIGACSRIHLDDALSFVATAGATECDATQVAVFLSAGDDSDQMNIIRFEGRLLLPTKPVRAPVSGIAGLSLRSGQLLNIANCSLHPKFEPLIDGKKFIPVVSMLACPIRSPAGDLIGVLAFQNKRAKTSLGEAEESTDPLAAHGPHAARKRSALASHSEEGWGSFGPNDETIIKAAVSGLAVAFAQHDLLNQASAITQRLIDLSRDIEEPDRLFAHIAAASARICRAERCLIFMLDDSDELVGPRWMRAVGAGAPSLVLPCSLGVAGTVVKTGGITNLHTRNEIKPLIDAAEAMAAEESLATCSVAIEGANEIMASILRYAGMLRGLHSAMALPLMLHDGRVTGVMELANKRGGDGRGFTSADERAMLLLASHARSMLGHSAAHAAAAARHRAQRATLRCVSELAQQVASAFARNGNVAEAYSRMVRAACQVLGVVRGRIHLYSPGSNRRLMTYDEDGRTVGSGARPSAAVSAVLDLGILVNTTAAAVQLSPLSPGSDSGADRASTSAATVYTEPSSGADACPAVQARAEADRRLLCAPIADKSLQVWRGGGRDPSATAGGRRAVLGVLEVESEEAGKVWRGEDEEALMHVAGVAGSLLDVMRNLRPPHPALAASSGRRRSLVFDAEFQAL